jgi:MraZ protein
VEHNAVLRGTLPAKIDDKGRLKVPNGFRTRVQETHGPDVFVTSLTGESVRIYPMPVWQAIETKLAAVPSSHPSRAKFLDRVNYFGQVAVFGQYDHLEIWNHERFVSKLQREPFTDDDAKALSEFGI